MIEIWLKSDSNVEEGFNNLNYSKYLLFICLSNKWELIFGISTFLSPPPPPRQLPQTFLTQTSPFFTEKGLKTGACPGICKGGPNIWKPFFFFFFFCFSIFQGGPAQKIVDKMAKYRWNSLKFALMTFVFFLFFLFFFAFQFLGGGGPGPPPWTRAWKTYIYFCARISEHVQNILTNLLKVDWSFIEIFN